jgi:hypothetical protein
LDIAAGRKRASSKPLSELNWKNDIFTNIVDEDMKMAMSLKIQSKPKINLEKPYYNL